MAKLILKDEVYAIIGAAMEVHKELGCGFLEPVYQEAMALELADRGIPFQPQVELRLFYKRKRLSTFYKADFVGYESIIILPVPAIMRIDRAIV